MPIKGKTDKAIDFPNIGSIRKGAVKGENRPGKDLTYFRVEFDEQEKKAIADFAKLYPGDKPQELRIVLPFDNIDRCWDAWLEAYVAGSMIARSDGERYTFLRDHKTGEVLVQNGIEVATGKPKKYIDGETVATYKSKKNKTMPVYCLPVGRLKVILPELIRFAFLTVHTSSVHDIMNISGQLAAIQRLNGTIVGVPMLLKRRPKKISTPSGAGGKRVRREKWLLSIEADPEWVRAKLLDMKQSALPGNGMALLPEETPEIIVIEPQEIEEEQPEETPKINNGDPVTAYYDYAYNELGMKEEEAKQIYDACGEDAIEALKELKENHTPK